MSEVKHTPGPWRLKTTGNYGNTIEARTGDDADGHPRYSVVCSYQSALPRGRYTFDVEEQNAQSNGRLIAAAPELLDHLKSRCADLRASLDCVGFGWDGDQRACAELEYASSMELIARAEGRP